MKYRMLEGSHGRFEDGKNTVYRKGDAIELSAEQAEAFGDRVAPWTDDEPEAEELGAAAEPRETRRSQPTAPMKKRTPLHRGRR